ncbi:MAG: beta-N-acetylhexosaminidase [Myxococcales bacterium]|nr:beta-N-acetylhexosaminidase [Myxococcales bacterium]
MVELTLSLPELCGQLIVGGFEGTELPESFRRALAAGQRGGAILFRRNLKDVSQVQALCRSIAAAAPKTLPPFIGVDQEGGRVVRLPEPCLALPPMRVFGRIDDPAFTYRAAAVLGSELAALGFNLDFAPVLDVDSNPDNPIIGDRSFGSEVSVVTRHALSFIDGLQSQRVLACGKHYPGHGDTAQDSHVALPRVERELASLRATELLPFQAACGAGVASLMTAHVVYPALAPDVPATFSSAICTELLRGELGFQGVLFSDDLEMGAVTVRYGIEEAAVAAIAAGCDALLVCRDEALQVRAHTALLRRAESDPAFFERCREAAVRSLLARRRCPPRASALGVVGGEHSQHLRSALARAQASLEASGGG